MIERLRELPSYLRYLAYVGGALLAFFVALGVGVAAATVAINRAPAETGARLRAAAAQAGLFLAVLAGLWALWEGFKWFGEATDLRLGSFRVDDRTLPHLHDIVATLFEPSRRNGPLDRLCLVGRR